jgi:hypothetical protein
MKKDYIVSRIEASQDGAPYAHVAVSDPNDYKQGVKGSRILLTQK